MRCFVLMVVIAFAMVAHGDVIWDESVHGDLSNDQTAPTDITLVSDSDDVIGTVGGANPGEFFDCMRFDVPVGHLVIHTVLTDYIAAGGNTTSGYNLYTGTPPDITSFGDLCSAAVGPADVGQDLLSTACRLGPLPPGTYTLCWREGTPDQAYVVTYVSDEPLFYSGFETGNTTEWFATVPQLLWIPLD